MTLYKTPRGWRFDFIKNGERITGSFFQTKKEALQKQEEARREAGKKKTESSGTDFKTVAYTYLDYAERKFAEKTYKQKAFVYKSFATMFGTVPIEQINSHHLHQYLNTRNSNNNYNAHRKDLCALFTFAKRTLKLITYNPCWDLDQMPHTPEEKYIPPESDILKLISAASPENDEKDIILTILNTAARVDEVLRLQWKDINFEKRTLTRWTKKRKGGAYESITCHLNDDLYRILKRRWDSRLNEMWVFYNIKTGDRFHHRPKMMKGLCKKAGIEPAFGFHSIRHFIASYLADKEKISKKTIGALLGHKSLQTTEIYLHSISESEVQAIESLSGKFRQDHDESQAQKIV